MAVGATEEMQEAPSHECFIFIRSILLDLLSITLSVKILVNLPPIVASITLVMFKSSHAARAVNPKLMYSTPTGGGFTGNATELLHLTIHKTCETLRVLFKTNTWFS